MKCLVSGKEFSDYKYQSVVFSADAIPVCPFCRQTPYDAEYKNTHEDTHDKQQKKQMRGFSKVKV